MQARANDTQQTSLWKKNTTVLMGDASSAKVAVSVLVRDEVAGVALV